MGSALNRAAKGSQLVIQGAKGLSRNVHARTRQPTPPVIPRASRRRNAGPGGQQIPPDRRGEKQGLLTLRLCSLSISTPSSRLLPLPPPQSLTSPKGPSTGIVAPPHPPRQTSRIGDWGQPY